MDKKFDVIVIGAGPGGYIAAIRAAQLGFAVACIDDWKNPEGGPAPGGTCTNVGCIPSKALLQSSEHYEHALHAFAGHGIEIGAVKLDLGRMQARKDQVVRQNNDGVLYLFRKNGVTFIHGRAAFDGAATQAGYRIRIEGYEGGAITGTHIVLATGSVPRALPGVAFDETRILSSTGALALAQVPRRLGIVGAGVIGLELGSVWRRLGAEVTLLEAAPALLPFVDRQIAQEAYRQFTRQGLAFELGAQVEQVVVEAEAVQVTYTDGDGQSRQREFDHLVVSIGRLPQTAGLAAEAVGLGLDAQGFIAVDDACRTNLPNVWAVGDVVRGPMLAHKAEEEGVAVAERIAGQHGHVNFGTIPSVVYTAPELAWVGRNEQQLQADGVAYKAGVFPFMANGRARAMGEPAGMVKVLADAATDEILGVHVLGAMASELIAEAVMAMEFRASAEDMARICHAHPTLAETMKEAALAVDARALNC